MHSLPRVLVVTGMHRSGASLLAGLAAAAGFDLGARDLPPHRNGRRRGGVEDPDFVHFHDDCLEQRGSRSLHPPASMVAHFAAGEARQAAALLARRAAKPLWGWQDPRTTLFLAAWGGILPGACFLFSYRHPVEVALSLLRRGPEGGLPGDPWSALRAWTLYNRALLAFRAAHPGRSLLWPIAAAERDPAAVLRLAVHHFALPIAWRPHPGEEGPRPRRRLRARDVDWAALLPEAMAIFARLEQAADPPRAEPGSAEDEEEAPGSPRERDLEEANERLLAAALTAAPAALAATAAGPRSDTGTAPAPPGQPDGDPLQRLLTRQAARIEQLQEEVAWCGGQLEARDVERTRLEATRAWRLVHAYWSAARRCRGFGRQGVWRLRRFSGTLPRLRPEEIVIGCVAENSARHLAQARRLVQSLRWFGGSLAGARMLVCVVGGMAPEERAALERAGAEVRTVERFDRRNGSANKLQLYAEALATGARGLLLLDCDTAIVGDPAPLLAAGAVQAKIADLPTVTHEVFVRLFRHFGLALPPRRYRTTHAEDRTILYCNAGVVFMTREVAREFVPVWREWNARILDVLPLLGDCAHHCHQASLSLALAAHPIPFAEAPAALNFPLHLRPERPAAALLASDPVILHYHGELDGTGRLLPSRLPRVQARIEAFNLRLGAALDGATLPGR